MNLLVLNSLRAAVPSLLFPALARNSSSPSILIKASGPLAYKPIQFGINVYTKRSYSTPALLNIDVSNLTKDVIVYKYNNPRYFKLLNIFAMVQFVFWTAMVEFSLFSMRDTPVDETSADTKEQPVYKKINLGSDRFRYGLGSVFLLIGKWQSNQ